MVCISGKAETEGIAERVPAIKNEKDERIDLLFEQNAAEQLAGVNWDKLNTAVRRRLDETERSRASARRWPVVIKIGAVTAAAAAIVFITLMVRPEKTTDLQLKDGRKAAVKFSDVKGSASVEIMRPADKAWAMVDIGAGRRKLARCDVKITEPGSDRKKAEQRPSWIIVRKHEPVVVASNGANKDMMSMICLF